MCVCVCVCVCARVRACMSVYDLENSTMRLQLSYCATKKDKAYNSNCCNVIRRHNHRSHGEAA